MKARIVFAVLLCGILFAPRAAAEPPAVFIKLLYGNYTNMDHWAKGYDPCREYCEDDFAKLLKAARAKNKLDYDPICQCKHGGEKYVMFSGATGATDQDYRVTMMKLGDPRASWVCRCCACRSCPRRRLKKKKMLKKKKTRKTTLND